MNSKGTGSHVDPEYAFNDQIRKCHVNYGKCSDHIYAQEIDANKSMLL